jgi:LysR family transcriptional regulator for bpeEF and oprC
MGDVFMGASWPGHTARETAAFAKRFSIDCKTMKNLHLDHFALFVQIAAARSLSAVARDRNVPVSRISRALSHIEAESGMHLFRRTTHGLSLTSEGDIFLEHAQRFVAEQGMLEDRLARRSRSISGVVRISVAQLFAEYLLIPQLLRLRTQHPDLHVDLHVSDGMADMASDGIDILVRAGASPADHLIARALGQHGRALFAAPSYLAAHGEPQHPDELASHVLITNTAAPLHNQWAFRLDEQPTTRAMQGAVRVNNSAAVMALALAGAGIARINDVLGYALVEQGRLRPVLSPYCVAGVYHVHAAILAERRRAPKIRVTTDWLASCFAAFSRASTLPPLSASVAP